MLWLFMVEGFACLWLVIRPMAGSLLHLSVFITNTVIVWSCIIDISYLMTGHHMLHIYQGPCYVV